MKSAHQFLRLIHFHHIRNTRPMECSYTLCDKHCVISVWNETTGVCDILGAIRILVLPLLCFFAQKHMYEMVCECVRVCVCDVQM